MSKQFHEEDPSDEMQDTEGSVNDQPGSADTDLTKKLAEAEQKASQYWDRLLRMQADTDNVARRVERDVANAHKYALEKFVAELIPIVDSLELCLSNVPGEMQESAAAVIEGVNLTLKMFYSALEKFAVEIINPLNEPFDPEYSQAISVQEDADYPAGTVISVLQKGYTLNGRLIRPALVCVAKA